ncbi:MAG: CoA-acylating methylmalonate-semialdehyde dehydrogenase [Legionellales bacterium]|nr:CoA-acylating methylmalonate-semialdehyde dehydrogenase [Legionellales bacterium]
MTYHLTHLINGQPHTGSSSRSNDLFNPATGELIGHVPLAEVSDVNLAVAAAKAALPAWSNTPVIKRVRILAFFKHLIEENISELASIITREHGKTLDDAKGSILRGIEVLEFILAAPYLLEGRFSDQVSNGIDCYSIRQAVGVCVGITPFNFPAMIPLWMFPVSIACGNTFVLKPSERDPSCAQHLVKMAHEAGIPDGVINLIHGDKVAVDALLAHPDVAAVSFVGSTPIAEYVHHTASLHRKRVQAFGGAKNHAVIMPDADIKQAADAIAGAAFGSCGQRCMAISVAVVVGDKLAEKLLPHLIGHANSLRIGKGDQPNIDMGPLVSAAQREKVLAFVESGVNEGATLVVDGREYKHPDYPHGYYLGAHIFDHVHPEMLIYQEEIFGPVLCIVRVSSEDEALKLINAHPYANGTAIFTRDGDSAREFSRRVEVGMVGINVAIPVPVAQHSFGGWKRSRFSDLGMFGQDSILFNTKLKTITTRWPGGLREQSAYVMPSHE